MTNIIQLPANSGLCPPHALRGLPSYGAPNGELTGLTSQERAATRVSEVIRPRATGSRLPLQGYTLTVAFNDRGKPVLRWAPHTADIVMMLRDPTEVHKYAP
eukprot:TRINITY_DN135363_c0_g1_i2.p1 TRINITY_DN135363_c0_g1~~TRINITY_DN135363_c0_g1_i2.p1  ORF type:complete len:102 (-),score=7.75 TRINITY_DN135363_c0_g1_i2:300-605(-)